jgi:hypothetical protein
MLTSRCGCIREAGHSEDARPALVGLDRGFVVAVYDGSAAETAQCLRGGIDGEFVPGKFAIEAIDECDSRVEVAAGCTSDVDTEHNADTPSPGYGLILAYV